MSKRFIALSLTAAVVGLTASCGLSAENQSQSTKSIDTSGELSGEVSFQSWSLKSKFKDYFDALIKDFETKNPKVKINWIDQPGEGYADKITSQITSNNLPDVVNLPPDIAYSAAKAGALIDVKRSIPDLEQTYQKSGLDAYTYRTPEGTFGLPWYLGTDVSFFNNELMAKAGIDPKSQAPTTLDELITQAAQVHEKTGGEVLLMSRKPNIADIASAGVSIMDDQQKKFVFNTPEAAAIIDKYAKAYQAGYMPKGILTNEYLGNSDMFKKEQVAWTTAGGSFIENTAQTDPLLAPKMVPAPAVGDPQLYAQALSVNAKSKNAKAALAFAKFVTNDENQINFTTKTAAKGYFPGSKGKSSDETFSRSDGSAHQDATVIAWKSLAKAKIPAPPLWSNPMEKYLGQQIADAMTGRITAQQAVDNAVQKANSLLNY